MAERLRFQRAANEFIGELSSDAVGLMATLFALNHLGCVIDDEKAPEHYARLLAFAGQHAEYKHIRQTID